ncbi:MAG TPA: hypothetical protein PLV83_03720 [Bacilli bacterium]|nr:hypothetical protein [Bacilli bacterium]
MAKKTVKKTTKKASKEMTKTANLMFLGVGVVLFLLVCEVLYFVAF